MSDRKARKEQEQVAAAAIDLVTRQIATGDTAQIAAALQTLNDSSVLVGAPDAPRWPSVDRAVRGYAETALADDVLTEHEGQAMLETFEAIGVYVDVDVLNMRCSDRLARLLVARVNDGRLGEVEQPERILPKRGEIVHVQVAAALLKEVSVRQWQGGTAGVSFRVAKGVSFRTGQVKGRSVVVGTEIKVDDTGVLSGTSTRVVFLGDRKTVDIPYSNLVGLDVFSDGISLRSSSRQIAVNLRVNEGYGEVVAATINGAMQAIL